MDQRAPYTAGYTPPNLWAESPKLACSFSTASSKIHKSAGFHSFHKVTSPNFVGMFTGVPGGHRTVSGQGSLKTAFFGLVWPLWLLGKLQTLPHKCVMEIRGRFGGGVCNDRLKRSDQTLGKGAKTATVVRAPGKDTQTFSQSQRFSLGHSSSMLSLMPNTYSMFQVKPLTFDRPPHTDMCSPPKRRCAKGSPYHIWHHCQPGQPVA